MKYSDIIQYTQQANYYVNVEWGEINDKIQHISSRNEYITEIIPDFQRGHVWTKKQQIKYIEFKLKGGTGSNDLLWNCPGWMTTFEGPYQLVDGLQRLTAVRMFINNKIPAFNIYHSEFKGRIPSHCEFLWHVNDLKTREEVLQWYIEITKCRIQSLGRKPHKVKQLLIAEKPKKRRSKCIQKNV